MTSFSDALQQDIAGNISDAASLYEQSIHGEDVPLDAYLNLAVLYWECTDPGFNTGRQLPHDLFLRAPERYETVLLAAEQRLGYAPEIKFWKLYFEFTSQGEPPFVEECRILVAEPDSTLVPYFYLYSASNGQQYWQQASQLLALCKALPTTKNRYIISIIEATALRANTAAGKWHDKKPTQLH